MTTQNSVDNLLLIGQFKPVIVYDYLNLISHTTGAGIPLQDPTRFGNELEADFLLDNLNCTGDEETLFACLHPGITIHDGCFLPFADASLICGTTGEYWC